MNSGATMSRCDGLYMISIWGKRFTGITANEAIDSAWHKAKKGPAVSFSIPPAVAKRINERIEADRFKMAVLRLPYGWAVAA